ncbi:class I SAM-dependent methyltransferase [Wukongibacter sp. M2B1]|uniref:class I SAM-dependent methyltransferase n=1 Tax=Wukongibacter sp. M2B1 TaxID=3088895 RepID=UPI003D7A6AE3
MKNINLETNELEYIFSVIGLSNKNGKNYRQRLKKNEQIYNYLLHLNKAVDRLSRKREIVLVDCACGKSYLAFIANYYFTKIARRKIKFVCIDYDEYVITASRAAAEKLKLNNMEFICDDIFNVKFQVKPDIVYSLHACDTATDMTIAKGILEDAKYIMTVSCCQHTVRNKIKKHPLTSITKHGVYKERLVDMIADSMRTLLLESKGYKVNVFEYVSSSKTPKNVMVRAVKGGGLANKNSIKDYKKLHNIFNVQPKLGDYIRENL